MLKCNIIVKQHHLPIKLINLHPRWQELSLVVSTTRSPPGWWIRPHGMQPGSQDHRAASCRTRHRWHNNLLRQRWIPPMRRAPCSAAQQRTRLNITTLALRGRPVGPAQGVLQRPDGAFCLAFCIRSKCFHLWANEIESRVLRIHYTGPYDKSSRGLIDPFSMPRPREINQRTR